MITLIFITLLVIIVTMAAKYLIPMIVRKIINKMVVKWTANKGADAVCKPMNARQTYSQLKLFVFGLDAINIVFYILFFIMLLCTFLNSQHIDEYLIKFYFIFLVGIGVLSAYLIVNTIIHIYNLIKKPEKYSFKLLKKIYNSYFNWAISLSFITLLVLIIPMFNPVQLHFWNVALNFELWYTLIYVIIFALCLVEINVGKKLISSLFGIEALADDKKAVNILSVPSLLEIYNKEKSAMPERAKSDFGLSVVGIKPRKSIFVTAGVALIVYLIVFIISLSMFARSSDIYRLPVVMKVSGMENAVSYLGEPMKKTEDKKNDYYVYEYYSGEYGKIVKKIESLTKAAENVDSFDKLFKLMEEQAKLEEKLENLEYKQIRVVQTSNDFRVYLNTAGGKTASGNKWNENDKGRIELGYKVQYVSSLGDSGYEFNGINYENIILGNVYNQLDENILTRIYYNDGSYAYYPLTYKYKDLQKGENVLTWSDSWGSYSVTVNVTN